MTTVVASVSIRTADDKKHRAHAGVGLGSLLRAQKLFNGLSVLGRMVNAFDPSTQEVEVGLSLRPAWPTST